MEAAVAQIARARYLHAPLDKPPSSTSPFGKPRRYKSAAPTASSSSSVAAKLTHPAAPHSQPHSPHQSPSPPSASASARIAPAAMENEHDFEPTGMSNFFQRYHEARASRSPPATPPATQKKPPSSPSTPSAASLSKTAQSTWTKVFMPLGRSATSADRYDLSPGQKSKPGHSVSELHAKGSGISLDAKNDEE